MKKLTDLEKLKYWIDSEFTVVHILLAIVMLQVTENLVWNIIIGLYIAYSAVYLLTRLAVIAADDPDYLRVPKQ